MSSATEKKIVNMAKAAKKASLEMASLTTNEKNAVLKKMAKRILANKAFLIRENRKDLKAAEGKNYSKSLVDRLLLNEDRIKGMAGCLLDTAKIKDPVGKLMETIKRPNGLIIKKVRTPIGVVGIIYESRPNVTSDCIGLCLKSSNAVILKGGKEAYYSNKAIFKILKDAVKGSPVPANAVNLISSVDRQAVNHLLKLDQYVDVIIPRGGESLIEFVAGHSRIPVIKHYKGICHTYISEHADLNMAHKICLNAKTQRPGVCNAMETMLVHRDAAIRFLPRIIDDMKRAGVEIRGDTLTKRIVKNGVKAATNKDWDTEYLDLILSVKVVHSLKEAIDHINTHGSHHSDAIVTESKKEAEKFFKAVDSSTLYHNASTRFTDGYEFGFGAEVGISTDKLHARGPMALEELTTYKYTVFGKGQIKK